MVVKQGRKEDGGMDVSLAFSELDPLPQGVFCLGFFVLFCFYHMLLTKNFMTHKWTQVLSGTPTYLNCCLSFEGRAKGLSWPSLWFCLQQ